LLITDEYDETREWGDKWVKTERTTTYVDIAKVHYVCDHDYSAPIKECRKGEWKEVYRRNRGTYIDTEKDIWYEWRKVHHKLYVPPDACWT